MHLSHFFSQTFGILLMEGLTVINRNNIFFHAVFLLPLMLCASNGAELPLEHTSAPKDSKLYAVCEIVKGGCELVIGATALYYGLTITNANVYAIQAVLESMETYTDSLRQMMLETVAEPAAEIVTNTVLLTQSETNSLWSTGLGILTDKIIASGVISSISKISSLVLNSTPAGKTLNALTQGFGTIQSHAAALNSTSNALVVTSGALILIGVWDAGQGIYRFAAMSKKDKKE